MSSASGKTSTKCVFVKNFPLYFDEDRLYREFKRFGELSEVVVVRSRETNRPRGFAYLTFTESSSATRAVKEMDNKDIEGRLIRVERSTTETRNSKNKGLASARSRHSPPHSRHDNRNDSYQSRQRVRSPNSRDGYRPIDDHHHSHHVDSRMDDRFRSRRDYGHREEIAQNSYDDVDYSNRYSRVGRGSPQPDFYHPDPYHYVGAPPEHHSNVYPPQYRRHPGYEYPLSPRYQGRGDDRFPSEPQFYHYEHEHHGYELDRKHRSSQREDDRSNIGIRDSHPQDPRLDIQNFSYPGSSGSYGSTNENMNQQHHMRPSPDGSNFEEPACPMGQAVRHDSTRRVPVGDDGYALQMYSDRVDQASSGMRAANNVDRRAGFHVSYQYDIGREPVAGPVVDVHSRFGEERINDRGRDPRVLQSLPREGGTALFDYSSDVDRLRYRDRQAPVQPYLEEDRKAKASTDPFAVRGKPDNYAEQTQLLSSDTVYHTGLAGRNKFGPSHGSEATTALGGRPTDSDVLPSTQVLQWETRSSNSESNIRNVKNPNKESFGVEGSNLSNREYPKTNAKHDISHLKEAASNGLHANQAGSHHAATQSGYRLRNHYVT